MSLHPVPLDPGPGFCVSVCIRKVSDIFLFSNSKFFFGWIFRKKILREWGIMRNFAALKARSAALGHYDSLMV